MARAILFDLDDTLYLEEDFVRSGITAVVRTLAPRLGVDQDELGDQLWYDFRRLGRAGLFDRLIGAFPDAALTVPELVAIYRDHEPVLALSRSVCALLSGLRQHYRLAIVTDGLPAAQRKKIAALGLETMVDAIVYPWELGAPKPAPLAFQEACRLVGVTPDQASSSVTIRFTMSRQRARQGSPASGSGQGAHGRFQPGIPRPLMPKSPRSPNLRPYSIPRATGDRGEDPP